MHGHATSVVVVSEVNVTVDDGDLPSRGNDSNVPTEDWLDVLAKWCTVYVEGVGITSMGTIGVVINIVALFIVLRKKVMRNFHLLMCCLSVYDLIHVALEIVIFSLPAFSREYRDKVLLHMVPYALPVTQIALTGSCYTTIAITVERFLSIRHPFLIQKHNIKARMFLVPVFFYSIIYNIPRFFELRVKLFCKDGKEMGEAGCGNGTEDNEGSFYGLDITATRNNPAYIFIYVNMMSLIFNLVLPFAVMITLNYLVYCTMHKADRARPCRSDPHDQRRRASVATYDNGHVITSLPMHAVGIDQGTGVNDGGASNPLANGYARSVIRRTSSSAMRRRESRITRASIAITVMFVVCNLPRCIPNIMEMFISSDDSPRWLPILVSVNHLLSTANSAFNFLFYLSYCWGRKSSSGRSRWWFRGNSNTAETEEALDPATTNSNLQSIKGAVISVSRKSSGVVSFCKDNQQINLEGQPSAEPLLSHC